jgi:tetratricopeptide (TPR) repeat protein
MLTRIQIKTLALISFAIFLTWLGGCGGLTPPGPAAAPQLSAEQHVRAGAAAAEKLVQILGGPYHDKRLAADLNRLAARQASRPLVIAVADRSAAELYALPGERIVMTRGLLAGLRSRAELDSLLRYAAQLAGNAYRARLPRGMVEAAGQVLSTTNPVFDPDAPEIRLARLVAREPCAQDCLAPVLVDPARAGTPGSPPLPESVRRLAGLQPGFELLASAREYEQREDQGKAIATYLQAAAITPDEPYLLGALGLAYLRAGQLQPARLHLQKAVELQPDYYRTLMGLGYLSLQQGKYQQANELLAESVRLLAVAENLFLLAEARENSGDAAGAIALYRLVVEADRYGKLGRSAAERLAQTAGAQ